MTRRTLIAMETGTTNGRLASWFRVAQAFDVELQNWSDCSEGSAPDAGSPAKLPGSWILR